MLFGGYNATSVPVADTWRFSGGNWAELTSANHPSAHVGTEIAWYGPEAQSLLYGGTSGPVQPLDTWAFHNGGWFPLAPAALPPPSGPASTGGGPPPLG